MASAGPGPRDPARVFFDSKVRDLFKNLPHAMVGEEEPIHQVRVSSRRVRVLLGLLALKPAARRAGRARRRLRDLGRMAGASRDLDVCVSLLEPVCGRKAGAGPEAAALLRRLRQAQRRAHRRMAESLLDFGISGLRRDMGKVLDRGTADTLTTRLRLKEVREEKGRLLIESLDRLGGRYDPVALHEIRAQARRLRYAAELGNVVVGAPSEAPKRFKEIQDQLGELHDLWVLAEWLSRQAARAEKGGRAAEAAGARRLEEMFRASGREIHAKFVESRPVSVVRRALSFLAQSAFVA